MGKYISGGRSMRRLADYGYNERLFSGGIRASIHYSRFRWLARSLAKVGSRPKRVLELGCFDGKSINFLPAMPDAYLGLDANWEGGLDLAREKWKEQTAFRFLHCTTPDDVPSNERFDVSICMETLEHVPPHMVEPYLAKLCELTETYIFITVPNEKGLVFALKYLVKRVAGGDFLECTLSEFINQTIGRMHRVKRHEHKGFDYEVVVGAVSKYFDIIELSPYPMRGLPRAFGFGIGIIGKKPHSHSLAINA